MRTVKNRMSAQAASELATYLSRGYLVIDVMERLADVLDGTAVAETASLMTDGEWCWREDLAHYVEKYRLGLPDQFVSEIAQRGGVVPQLTEEALASATHAALATWQGARND